MPRAASSSRTAWETEGCAMSSVCRQQPRESTLLDDFEKDSKAPSIHSHIPMHYVNNTSLTSRKLDGTLGRCTTCAAFGRSRVRRVGRSAHANRKGRSSCSGTPESGSVLLRHAGEGELCTRYEHPGRPVTRQNSRDRAVSGRATTSGAEPPHGRQRRVLVVVAGILVLGFGGSLVFSGLQSFRLEQPARGHRRLRPGRYACSGSGRGPVPRMSASTLRSRSGCRQHLAQVCRPRGCPHQLAGPGQALGEFCSCSTLGFLSARHDLPTRDRPCL